MGDEIEPGFARAFVKRGWSPMRLDLVVEILGPYAHLLYEEGGVEPVIRTEFKPEQVSELARVLIDREFVVGRAKNASERTKNFEAQNRLVEIQRIAREVADVFSKMANQQEDPSRGEPFLRIEYIPEGSLDWGLFRHQ